MAGSDEDFLSRWSRRKRADRAGTPLEERPPASAAVPASAAATVPDEAARPPEPLPPVESLTPDSDFTPFMDRRVDPGLRRQALKKMFSDPRFNVMDGLDVYIDDYSIPDPMPEEWLGKLAAMSGLGDVPGRLKAEREAREMAEREARERPEPDAGEPDGREAAAPGAEAGHRDGLADAIPAGEGTQSDGAAPFSREERGATPALPPIAP